jgi:anti-anti-sigma factor
MPDHEFAATVRLHDGVPIIDLAGEVNAFAEDALNSAFTKACASGPSAILLNFQHVSYVNSTGIALIVALLAQARKARMQLIVAGLSEHYRHVFSITRLADFMTICDDEAGAIAAASPSKTER